MLYIKVLIAVVGVGMGSRVKDYKGGEGLRVDDEVAAGLRALDLDDIGSREDLLRELEKKVIDRSRQDPETAYVNNSDFKTQMEALLNNVMNRTITKSAEAQQSIDTSFATFATCTKRFADEASVISDQQTSFNTKKNAHTACRTKEDELWTEQDTCKTNVAKLDGEHKACRAEIQNHTKSPEITCKPEDGETYKAWMERLKTHFTTALVAFGNKETKCDKTETELDTARPACENKTTAHTTKKSSCDTEGVNMDAQACEAASTATTACNEQGTCHDDAVTSYNGVKAIIEKHEADHKVEHRTWKRINCLLGVVGNSTAGTANSGALQECIDARYSTEPVHITYREIPARPTCPAAPMAPCKANYLAAVYTPLPAHAKGQCTPCAGGGA